MAVEVYIGQVLQLSLSDREMRSVGRPLEALRAKTGRWVDPYGTSTLEPAHAKLLLELIREADGLAAATLPLVRLLERAAADGTTLLFEGD